MAGRTKFKNRHRSNSGKALAKRRAFSPGISQFANVSDDGDVVDLEQQDINAGGRVLGQYGRSTFNNRSKNAVDVAKHAYLVKILTAGSKQYVIKKPVNKTKTENPNLDLSNIKILTPVQPSRESEIIHQFSILNRYLQFGLKKENFKAAYEREVIERYEQLNEQEQRNAFDKLTKEFNRL